MIARRSLIHGALASLLILASCSEKTFPFAENPNSFLKWLQNKDEFKKGQVRYEFEEIDFDRGNGCHAFKKDDHNYYLCYVSLTEYDYRRLGMRRCRYVKVIYNRWNLGQTILTVDEETCTHFERISPMEDQEDQFSDVSLRQTEKIEEKEPPNIYEMVKGLLSDIRKFVFSDAVSGSSSENELKRIQKGTTQPGTSVRFLNKVECYETSGNCYRSGTLEEIWKMCIDNGYTTNRPTRDIILARAISETLEGEIQLTRDEYLEVDTTDENGIVTSKQIVRKMPITEKVQGSCIGTEYIVNSN